MKKTVFLLIMAIIFGTCAFAKDVIPSKTFGASSFGVYQISDHAMTLFEEPQDSAKVVKNLSWDNENTDETGLDLSDLFVVYLPDRDLALLEVVDETDDWVKVIYDQKNNDTAWLKKDDPYKFLPWNTFYNIYGKKYGLYELKLTPKNAEVIMSSPDDDAQALSTLNMPKTIKLNVIKGNWALVSVSDLDKYPKTGYIRWRGVNGEKYYFPLLKKVVGIN